MSSKKRKVSEENRKYGEHWEESYFFIMQNSKLTCLICRETISSFKEYNVRRHHETKHGAYVNFTIELRKIKLAELKSELKSQQKMFSSSLQLPSNIVKASYSVALIIAKKMKPFSDGEFVKECLAAVMNDVLPDKQQIISRISLSRQTICRRIDDISAEIVVSLQDRIRQFKAFSLAFDESIDISDISQLVVFIRGVNDLFDVTQEMLNLLHLRDTTRGEDVFNAIKKCLTSNSLHLDTLSGLTTDGAPAMVGKNKGAVKLFMNELEARSVETCEIYVIHCLIHQQNLCAHVLCMNHVMDVVIKVVNYIRSHALKHRQFKEYLNELSSQYGDIVYFTNVRWLSRGTCLKRFLELRVEIENFMAEEKAPVSNLNDEVWLLDLCFLVDITEKINQLNMELQGQDNLIIDACNNIKAFQMKLTLFESQLRNGNLHHFPSLKEFDSTTTPNFVKYADEIGKLQAEFNRRFSELKKYDKKFEIFSSPFQVDLSTVPIVLQLEIINLQCNDELKRIFPTTSKINFYKTYITAEKFPNLRLFAQKIVSAFGSTYVCETFFSKMNFNKSKFRASLTDENLENQLRCATTKIDVDLKKLSDRKEKQVSH